MQVARRRWVAIGVVSRLDRHREDGPRARIEHDRAGALRVPLAHCRAQHLLGVRLDAVIEREKHVTTRSLGKLVLDVEDVAGRVLDDRLLARMACEEGVELELEAREPVPVDADVAEHLRRDRALRIVPLLFGIEAEALQLQPLQCSRLRRIRLPFDIDEPVRAVGEQRIQAVRVQPERPLDRERGRPRVLDLLGVRVDGRGPLAEAELDAGAVVDRAAARRESDGFAVLGLPELRERRRAHALEPCRTKEQAAERDRERHQQEPDPPVDEAVHALRSLVRQLHVGGLVRRRLDETEPFRRETLDPGSRRSARELHRQSRVLGAQVGAFAPEVVELHVQTQDGDVQRDHTGEQCGNDPDPEHASGDATLASDCAGGRTSLRLQLPVGFCGPGRH